MNTVLVHAGLIKGSHSPAPHNPSIHPWLPASLWSPSIIYSFLEISDLPYLLLPTVASGLSSTYLLYGSREP